MRIHSICNELPPRDLRVLLLWPLDERILARLVEERDRVALSVVVARLCRRLDAVERRLEPVVRPAHQHVSNVADYGAWFEVDLCPGVIQRKLGHGLTSGADLETALALALEEECDKAPVSMGSRPMPDFSVIRLWRGEVV